VTGASSPPWSHDVLLAVSELAAALGFEQRASVANLRDRKADFPGPAEGEGRTGRYRLSDVLEWFERSELSVPAPPDVLPFLTRIVRRRLGSSADVDALRRAVAWVAAEVGGQEPGDELEQAYTAAGAPITGLLEAVRSEEKRNPLLAPAIKLHGVEAVVDAALTDGPRTTGGSASFSDSRLIDLVVRVADELGTFDVVADPCVGEGALAVRVAKAVSAKQVRGTDRDAAALAIFHLRCKLAAGLDHVDQPSGSTLVVCDAPLRDDAHEWIRRARALKGAKGSAIAVVEAASFGEREAYADIVELLESGELAAAVRLPEAMKSHGRVPGQALVVLGPSRTRSHVVIADHRGSTFEPPARRDRGPAALEESLRSFDLEVQMSGRYDSFDDFAEDVIDVIFDAKSTSRVPTEEIERDRRDDLWLAPGTGQLARQLDKITSSIEETVRALRVIADLANNPSLAPEPSGGRRMFEGCLRELSARIQAADSDLSD